MMSWVNMTTWNSMLMTWLNLAVQINLIDPILLCPCISVQEVRLIVTHPDTGHSDVLLPDVHTLPAAPVTLLDAAVTILDATVTILDAAVTLLDAAVTLLDATVTLLDAAVTLLDATVTLLDMAVTLLGAAVTLLDIAGTLPGTPIIIVGHTHLDVEGTLLDVVDILSDDVEGSNPDGERTIPDMGIHQDMGDTLRDGLPIDGGPCHADVQGCPDTAGTRLTGMRGLTGMPRSLDAVVGPEVGV